ncbi:MAG: PilC/PilY family type IV pilus protein, partial [Acetomicrobium sp.]
MKKFLSNINVIKRVFVMAAALAVIAFVPLGVLPQAAAEAPVLPSCDKPLPEGYAQSVQPNVLLLLDTSGSMTFTSASDTSTYGDGSKPYRYGDSIYRYFGRDRESSNNNPDRPYNYHPNLVYIDDADLTGISQGYRDTYFAKSGSRYLYPNDSRMYKLKLVLWEILNDSGLVSGLRLGLATYFQQGYKNVPSVTSGSWYRWIPTSSGTLQAISWEGSTDGDMRRALLKRFFRSTDEPGSIEEITQWIDGVESSNNPELRAHGDTPLAASIYGADQSQTNNAPYYGDARNFFLLKNIKNPFDDSGDKVSAINAWCQQNWLIVLTDGEDTLGGDPVTAVKKLYDEHTKDTWPSFYSHKAQPVRTMVIGLINPNASDVSKLKITLKRMADIGYDGKEDGKGDAYFATDVDELMQAFKDIFKQIQSFKSTGNAPLVSPPIGGQEGGVYVPNFTPRIERQWYGHFYKYVLSTEGVMSESPEWDAASKLDAKSYSARNVFTVNWKGGSWKLDFKESNASTLAPMLGLTQGQASKFIRWALGSDEWDEATGSERYKLGDIYHSGLVEIGPPRGSNPHGDYMTFKETHANREKLVYVQANDGMLHAFKADTGEEKWAFIPPNVLAEGRMAGMKQDLAKSGGTITVTWLDKAKSNPRYLLDGTMTAEDVLLSDGKYHTVLLGLLGYAGPGFYALDVTNPDDPQFMWAVENAIYNRKGDEVLSNQNTEWYVSYWSRSGGSAARTNTLRKDIADSSDLNYNDLRFTQSTPGIGYVSLYQGQNQPLKTQWVVIMGNGSQMRIEDNFSVASIYVINIENGKLLQVLKVPGMKQIITPVAILWTGSTRLVKHFYVGDDNGIIHEGDLTNSQPGEWKIKDVFDIKGSVGPSYILDCAYIDRNKWLFINTGDYETLMKDENVTDYMIAANISSGASSKNDLAPLTSAAGSVSTDVNGWYMEIPKDEYVTSPPVYYNGHIFFSSYIKSEDICSVGTSRIYVLNATTGKGAWTGGAKYVELAGVKVSGIVISEGKVYA